MHAYVVILDCDEVCGTLESLLQCNDQSPVTANIQLKIPMTGKSTELYDPIRGVDYCKNMKLKHKANSYSTAQSIYDKTPKSALHHYFVTEKLSYHMLFIYISFDFTNFCIVQTFFSIRNDSQKHGRIRFSSINVVGDL